MRSTIFAIFVACVAAAPASRPSFSSADLFNLPSPSEWKTDSGATTRPVELSVHSATRPSISALSSAAVDQLPDASAFQSDAHNVSPNGVSNK